MEPDIGNANVARVLREAVRTHMARGANDQATECAALADALEAAPPVTTPDWRAELLALADLECLNEDGAKGDDTYSCNRECVTCCARREVELLAAAPTWEARAQNAGNALMNLPESAPANIGTARYLARAAMRAAFPEYAPKECDG